MRQAACEAYDACVDGLWSELAARAGITLKPSQEATLNRYLDLLFQANRRMNLTRITDRQAAQVRHVADALTLLAHLPAGPASIADVGSGGGVPGLPLAIVRPEAQFVLIEATRKKAAFLRQAANELRLTNVMVLDYRAEQVARGRLRESFDVAVARAVASLAWLAEWCLPLLKIGGKMLAMKSADIDDELSRLGAVIRLLGGGQSAVHAVDLPGIRHHVIVEVRKLRKTDAKFPRDPTITGGRPLA